MQGSSSSAVPAGAWIITGPTSGIGRRSALELARHGTVVLVGRDPGKLSEVEAEIRALPGGHAVSVVCDLSDISSVRSAAAQVVSLHLPVAGLLNNAGVMPSRPGRSPQGWDVAFATHHLGPFAQRGARAAGGARDGHRHRGSARWCRGAGNWSMRSRAYGARQGDRPDPGVPHRARPCGARVVGGPVGCPAAIAGRQRLAR